MAVLNTTTLGGLPTYDDPSRPAANMFRVSSGATRPGEGTVLMLRSDYDQLVNDGINAGTLLGGVFPLVMQGSPGPGLTALVVVCSCVPVELSTAEGAATDFVLVAIKDLRCVKPAVKSPDQLHYNCPLPGFIWNSGVFSCYSSTLKGGAGGTPYTWAQIASALQIPTIPSAPSWTPYNVVFDATDKAKIIDDIARRLYLVVGFDPTAALSSGQSPFTNATYCIPGAMSATNSALMQQATDAQIGGDPGSLNKQRLPGTFNVIFQGYNTDSSDPFAKAFYASNQSTGNGYGGSTEYLHSGDIIAVRKSSAWTNQSACDTIAKDLAARALAFRNQAPQTLIFAGIWPFIPDGAIRRVEFLSGPASVGATTRLIFGNEIDSNPLGDMQSRMDEVNNQALVGIGGISVSTGQGGTRYISGNFGPVPVKIAYSISDDSGVYPTCQIETGSATGMVPTGLSDPSGGTAMVKVINTAEQKISAALHFHWLNQSDVHYAWGPVGMDSSGAPIYEVAIGVPPFEVSLTETGGSSHAGDRTTQCTFVYTANYGTTQVGTGLSPDFPRPSIGKMVAASKGLGYFNALGTFVLLQAYEVADEVACS